MDIQKAATNDAGEVTGIYLNEYDKIVRPNRRFLVPNYFIQYWVSRLGPALSWVVISLQQACWRADDDTCTVAQSLLAEEIGLERHTVSRLLRDNPWRAWYIPEIANQPGLVDSRNGTYQPLPRQYSVYLSTPLIPEHLAGLSAYFRQSCPGGSETELERAADELLGLKHKEALARLEELAGLADQLYSRPQTVAQVAASAAGRRPEEGPLAPALAHKLNSLENYLVETGYTICRQYFRLEWVPRLGPAMAWLVMALRSACYYNPDTGELRDTATWPKKELAGLLGQTPDNLRKSLLAHPSAGYFFQVVEHKRQSLTVRVSLATEPLPAESQAAYWQRQPNPEKYTMTPPENPEFSTMTPPTNPEKCSITPLENPEKYTMTPVRTRKNVPSPPTNPEKCSIYKYFKNNKYFKESVPDVVGGNPEEDIRRWLSAAGLSGAGLEILCQRDPPLDREAILAASLYARAHHLGPGYLFRHLERNAPVDELFRQLAALDDATLARFEQAVARLKVQGGPVEPGGGPDPPIDPDQAGLFARFAEVVAGLAPATVASALARLNPDETAAPGAGEGETELDHWWAGVLAQLRSQLARGTFEAWLQDTRLLARAGPHFVVAVKNEFARDWLVNRLLNAVRRAVADQLRLDGEPEPPEIELEFVVP